MKQLLEKYEDELLELWTREKDTYERIEILQERRKPGDDRRVKLLFSKYNEIMKEINLLEEQVSEVKKALGE